MDERKKISRLYDVLEETQDPNEIAALRWAIYTLERSVQEDDPEPPIYETKVIVDESIAIITQEIEKEAYYSALDEAKRLPEKIQALINQVKPYGI